MTCNTISLIPSLSCQMKDFDAQAIWDMLPRMKDGHTLDQVSVQEITRALNTIENCLLTSCPSGN